MTTGKGIEIVLYALALWAGFYVLSRDTGNRRLQLAAAGEIGLALLLVLDLFARLNSPTSLWRIGLLVIVTAGMIGVGLMLAARYAREQGEAFLPDLFHSFDYSMLAALVFGGQIVLVMGLNRRLEKTTLALLLTIIASSIAMQVFSATVQNALDKFILARFPKLRRDKAEIRAAATALPRVDSAVDFDAMEEAEFARLTRRALSHLNDLPRLAASPLTYLPLIDNLLIQRDVEPNTLARANELKTVLIEIIVWLKPPGSTASGTSDAWRHFNALYYPYVLGLKPYSVRIDMDDIAPEHRIVIEWFRHSVPERTLHNWQTAAAKLVALELRQKPKKALLNDDYPKTSQPISTARS